VGLFVVGGIAAVLLLAMKVSNLATFTERAGYQIRAKFDNVGGLKVRSPVTMAGVLIGRVAAIGFDEERYEAVVTLGINPQFQRIPTDTTASILTSGLLGEQYVGLSPGAEERYLKDGDEIKLTQSALILEKLIGQFLYRTAEGGGAK
jgi:phospholipid/cholesterol/gamma-HCH transport system substrate-binding protein